MKTPPPPTWVGIREPDGTTRVVHFWTGRTEGRIIREFPGMDALRIPVKPPAQRT